jgi:hypothetical protein
MIKQQNKEYTTMTKKEYTMPTTKVTATQPLQMVCASSTEGVNTQLQNSEVSSAWSRSTDSWDDDEE